MDEVAQKPSSPKLVWFMLLAGPAIDEHLLEFKEILAPGDIVIGKETHMDLQTRKYLQKSRVIRPVEYRFYD